jgi:hypothetical protein
MTPEVLLAELKLLKEEHAKLNNLIDSFDNNIAQHNLDVRMLKKRKLALRDRIALLESQIYPDIIA